MIIRAVCSSHSTARLSGSGHIINTQHSNLLWPTRIGEKLSKRTLRESTLSQLPRDQDRGNRIKLLIDFNWAKLIANAFEESIASAILLTWRKNVDVQVANNFDQLQITKGCHYISTMQHFHHLSLNLLNRSLINPKPGVWFGTKITQAQIVQYTFDHRQKSGLIASAATFLNQKYVNSSYHAALTKHPEEEGG